MLGPEGTAKRAAAWLTARLPARLRILETNLGLDPYTLADPAQVLDHERGPIALEDWPSVFVLPLRTLSLTLTDVEEDGAETYRATYSLRVLAWVRADTYEDTNALRNRYALAIREALLERKTLKTDTNLTAGDPHSDLAVDPASIVESYSDVLTDDEARTLAGVDVTVTVVTRERLAPPPPSFGTGTVEGINVTVHPSLA